MSHWTMAQQRLYRRQVSDLNAATGGHYGEDDRRALMRRVTGKASTGDLTREELGRVIDEQDRILGQCGRATARPRRRTFSQAEFIAELVRRLGWNDARLGGFIARQSQGWRRSLDALDRRQRSALIAALQGVLRSQGNGTAAIDRAPSHSTTGGVL